MLTSDPHLYLFIFLRLVVHFSLFLCSWKPHLFKCPLCDRYPSHRLCTQHPLGGGRWPSLSLAVSVCDHHPILYSFFSLAALLLSFSHSVFSLFSHPFSPRPPACLNKHEADFHRSSPPVFAWRHWDEGQKQHWLVGDDDSNTALAPNAAWPTGLVSLHGMHTANDPTVCLCSSSVICPMRGG